MQTIDDLLLSYKQLNEKIVKTQELNEKIFREIIMKKVKSSTNVLFMIDIIGWGTGIAGLLFFMYSIFKCSDRLDMLVMSLLLFGFTCLLMYVYGKTIKWRLANNIVADNDIRTSMRQIKEYSQQLVKQRKLSTILMIPIALLEFPVVLYSLHHKDYLEVLGKSWHHNRWLIYYLICLIPFILGFVWKFYDWINFPILRKIEANLDELKEIN